MSSEIDIHQLTAEERLSLIGDLWETLDESEVPVTPAMKAELDRRLGDRESDSSPGIPWEDVLRRLRDRDA